MRGLGAIETEEEKLARIRAAHAEKLDAASKAEETSSSSSGGWISSALDWFTGRNEPAAAPTQTTSTGAGQTTSNAEAIASLQAQRTTALELALAFPQQTQYAERAKQLESQIIALGGWPAAPPTQMASRPSQAVTVQQPDKPSAMTAMFAASQAARAERQRADPGSMMSLLGPMNVTGAWSTTAKVGVGVAGVAALSLGLYLALRPKS
jgi:hypothetical protein